MGLCLFTQEFAFISHNMEIIVTISGYSGMGSTLNAANACPLLSSPRSLKPQHLPQS